MGNCGGSQVGSGDHQSPRINSAKRKPVRKKLKKKSDMAKSVSSGQPRRHSLPGSIIGKLQEGLKGNRHGRDEDVQRELAKYTFFRSNIPENEPERKLKPLDHGQAQKQGKRDYMEDRTVCSKFVLAGGCLSRLEFLATHYSPFALFPPIPLSLSPSLPPSLPPSLYVSRSPFRCASAI